LSIAIGRELGFIFWSVPIYEKKTLSPFLKKFQKNGERVSLKDREGVHFGHWPELTKFKRKQSFQGA